jgi:hypothetical protein
MKDDGREQLSVNISLRCFIDAAGTCKDRQRFYAVMKEKGPQYAFQVFSNRVGINPVWLPKIKEIIDNGQRSS